MLLQASAVGTRGYVIVCCWYRRVCDHAYLLLAQEGMQLSAVDTRGIHNRLLLVQEGMQLAVYVTVADGVAYSIAAVKQPGLLYW